VLIFFYAAFTSEMRTVKWLQKFEIYGNCVATDPTAVPSFFYERSATPEELTKTGIQNM
jgi:hypothetical protein